MNEVKVDDKKLKAPKVLLSRDMHCFLIILKHIDKDLSSLFQQM